MQIAIQAATRAGVFVREAADASVRLGERLIGELKLTIDLARWRRADSWSERAASVSWPRAGALAVIALILGGGLFTLHLLTRSDAYPPPDPTARQIAARREALLNVSSTPPPSLVEANKSWKAE